MSLQDDYIAGRSIGGWYRSTDNRDMAEVEKDLRAQNEVLRRKVVEQQHELDEVYKENYLLRKGDL